MWEELERPAITITNNLQKERGVACVGVGVLMQIESRILHMLGNLSTTEPHP